MTTTAPTTLAVLFSDISGSTRLYETLGDARALGCIGLCLQIMREATLGHGGRVIKSIGDELMCTFATASAAANAAIEMQSRVSVQQGGDGQRLAIRIGFQYGPVIEEAGDVYGDGVNVASRLVGLARAGQILTTRESADAMTPDLARSARDIDMLAVKGRVREVAVCELLWQQNEDATMFVKSAPKVKPAANAQLKLRLGEREIVLDPNRAPVTLGRDAESALVLTDRMASREHARIEWHGDYCALIDLSSNGTYVILNDQPEIKLKRQQAILQGRGSISFGHTHEAGATEIVRFELNA